MRLNIENSDMFMIIDYDMRDKSLIIHFNIEDRIKFYNISPERMCEFLFNSNPERDFRNLETYHQWTRRRPFGR